MSRDPAGTYLDPRDREYAESLPAGERETVVATVARFRRPDRLLPGDALPALDLLALDDAQPITLRSLVDVRPLVLVFGSFT
jgi:hypothetical protein